MIFSGISEQQQNLLKVLAVGLGNSQDDIESKAITKELVVEGKTQAVVPLVFEGAIRTLGERKAEYLKPYIMSSIRDNNRIHFYHNYLNKIMTENGVGYCVLKGSASAWYYNNPALRVMGDVDFLVKRSEYQKAKNILEKDGFIQDRKEGLCHTSYTKENVRFELHFEPPGIPEGQAGEAIRNEFSDVFEKSITVKMGEYSFSKPCHFHHGLILIMHTYHHFLGEGIGLRHLCDFAAFVQYMGNDEFCDLFEAKLKAIGLWKFTQVLGTISYLALGAEYKSWMGKPDEELCNEVLRDILKTGNFGTGDKGRARQNIAVTNRGKGGISDNMILQTIKSMNDIAKTEFPVINRFKPLKSVGFIMLGTRHVFRVITGKSRRVSVNAALKGAKGRREMYKGLGLFESEEKEG